MRRVISNDSFFKYTPRKPFISSPIKFFKYCEINNIELSENSKKMAFIIYFDKNTELLYKTYLFDRTK